MIKLKNLSFDEFVLKKAGEIYEKWWCDFERPMTYEEAKEITDMISSTWKKRRQVK